MKKIEEKIVKPTVEGLKTDGIPYVGFIFFGLIKVQDEPYVIEYNVRMGDPETEVVMPRIKSPFLELLVKAGKGELGDASVELDSKFATTVMMVSGGYPESYEKGKEIQGLDKVGDVVVFHAGTKSSGENVMTSGGRVLAATGMGTTMKEALDKSYRAVDQIRFEKSYVRRDIGKDLI
jgi:phosphoribosylamine--glycine ligase